MDDFIPDINSEEFFIKTLSFVLKEKEINVCFLQRNLYLKYTEACQLMDKLERRGIVGPISAKKRKVLAAESEESISFYRQLYLLEPHK